MGKPRLVILLVEFFLLSMIVGLACAEETAITLTTDKATYSPGDTVYVTVTAKYPNYGCAAGNQLYVLCLSIVMIPMPPPACSYSCPTASATLLLLPPAYSNVAGFQGKVALHLPTDTPAGRYEVGMLACSKWMINGNSISCGGQPIFYQLPTLEITLEGKTAPNHKSG